MFVFQPTSNADRIAALTRKRDRLKDLYINDLIDLDTYKEDLNRYKETLKELERRPLKRDLSGLKELLKLDIVGIYKTLTEGEKQRFWRGFVERIEVNTDHSINVFFL